MVTSPLTDLTNQNNSNNEDYNQGIEMDPYMNGPVPFHTHTHGNHSHHVNHYHHHHHNPMHHSPVVIDGNQVYDVNGTLSSMNGNTDSIRRNSYSNRGRALIVSSNCDSVQNPGLINCTHHSSSSSSSPSHHHSTLAYCSNGHSASYVTNDGQVMFVDGQNTMERIVEQEQQQDQMTLRKAMNGMIEEINT